MKLYQHATNLYTRGRLRPDHLQELRDGRYRVIALAKLVPELALLVDGYEYRPLPDGQATPEVRERALLAAARAADLVKWNHPVIIHCNAGRNRACLVVALTLRELTGISGHEALQHVRSVRPRAVANPWFESWLEELA